MLVLLAAIVIAILLATTANHWYRASSQSQVSVERDYARHVARGGVRWAAARLERGESGAIERDGAFRASRRPLSAHYHTPA